MKKLILAVVLMISLNLLTQAKDAKPKKEQFGWNKKYMDEIGVSPEVQAKIETIKRENDAEAKVVRENTALSADEKKQQLQPIQQKRQKAIFALLTPEQLEKSKTIIARIQKAKQLQDNKF